MSKWTDPSRKQKVLMINRMALNTIDSYAKETEQPFDEIIKVEFEAFEQSLIKKCKEIESIRIQSYESAKKLRDEQELASQHPMPVSGHEEDPVGELVVSTPAQ